MTCRIVDFLFSVPGVDLCAEPVGKFVDALKYPLMFSICDVLLINKIDVMEVFDFDLEKCREYVWRLNPSMKVIPICAKTGEGVQEWADWLREQTFAWVE